MKGKQRLFIIGGILIVTGLIDIVTTPPSYALSLSKTVEAITRPVRTLLTGDSTTTQSSSSPQTSSSNTSTSATTQSSTSSNSAPPSSASADTGSITEAGIPPESVSPPSFDTTSLAPIPNTSGPNGTSLVAYAISDWSFGRPIRQAPVSDSMPIQQTTQGWRVLGILWYWWLLLAGLVVAGIIVMKQWIFKRFPQTT